LHTVADTGIGIPPDRQEAIFRAFEQADPSTTRLYGGTGLGLPISARIIEFMRGRIWVESEVGAGSKFHFTAHFGIAEDSASAGEPDEFEKSPDQAAAAPLPKLHILLAEDNVVNQRVTAGILEKRGHTIVVANNGLEALAALRTRSFDVVLMDVQMPEMDGLQATAELRKAEARSGRRTPVIALTARAMTSDRACCLEAGMDAYVAKPIQPQELLKTIAAVVAGQGRDETTDAAVYA
jgi:CheY-like chemotaxis protein